MLRIEDLFHHQEIATEFADRTPFCALMLGLGLGKTIAALTSAQNQLILGEVKHILIVAPLRVSNTVWHKEALNWLHTSQMTFSIATGSARYRKEALRKKANVHVINVENLKWMIKTYNSKWIWDMLILDESSAYKSEQSQRFAYLSRLCSNVPAKGWKNPVKRMIQLTATPATNGLGGLWSQMFLLDRGERLSKSFRQFKLQYFDEVGEGHSHKRKLIPVEGAKERIFKRVSDICLVMRSEDYLDIEEPIYNNIEVAMPDQCKSEYAKMKREFILNYPDGDQILATNAGALSNKLMQFANGAVYTGETPEKPTANREYRVVHDEKIKALVELHEAAEDSQTMLIAYWFKSDLKRIKAAIPDAVEMDKKGHIEERWNNGEIARLLIHPMSAGHGLNLQHGGSTMVFFSLLWSLELYSQTIGRLYRTGQKNPVSINHITTAGSMDQNIIRALRSNAETQSKMMEYLKYDLEREMTT